MISLIIPTRKRIESLNRLFNSIEETCSSTGNLEVLIAVDDDDIDTISFIEQYSTKGRLLIRTIIGKRGKGYLDLHNKISELCQMSSGKFLFFLADDVQFMTKDWDEKMLSTYNRMYSDNIFWVRTSHNEEGNPWAQCFAISRDWYNVTGHLGTCYQQDTEFNDVARYVGREVFIKDIVIIHHRADRKTGIINGKIDETHVEGRMAADAGLLRGSSYYSHKVQANIVIDAIKLLNYIRSLQPQGQNAEISVRIRSLYWEYIKAWLRPIVLARLIRKVIKFRVIRNIIESRVMRKIIGFWLIRKIIRWVMITR
jgi:glycosyltransferase involved in cell wall biosynthesis